MISDYKLEIIEYSIFSLQQNMIPVRLLFLMAEPKRNRQSSFHHKSPYPHYVVLIKYEEIDMYTGEP